MSHLALTLSAVALCSFFGASFGGLHFSNCPNGCSSRGVCANTTSIGTCQCYPGHTGTDCSLRVCPSSTAWVDVPSSSTAAHAPYAECSNMGTCDRATGQCKCRLGFEGAACDTLMCPVATLTSSIPEGTNITAICSGNGRCASLREVTGYQTFSTRLDYTQYTGWDADKIRGCLCEPGWGGVACEKRLCPKGDDPVVAGELGSNTPEIQLIDCLCTSCRGGLYISFEGQQTPLIPFDASEELIRHRLRQFSAVQDVQVKIVEGTQMCSAAGSVTRIKFIKPQGPHPSLSIVRGGGLKSNIKAHDISVRSKGQYSLIKHDEFSFVGQRNLVECSNRGVCNYETGMCECFKGFTSSNGLNGNGSIPDCGYRYAEYSSYSVGSTEFTTNCPVNEIGQVCSGHGTCNTATSLCTCSDGYSGPSCADRRCGGSFAWFGDINADHSSAAAGGSADCSGVGTCDTSTGTCSNCGGHWGVFHGDRCQYFSCPNDGMGQTCNNNGACLSMSEIGRLRYNEQKLLDPVYYDSPWDAHAIRGCSCFRAISVDGQYDLGYSKMISAFYYNDTSNTTLLYSDEFLHKFYRGPYAFAATDFKGYACEKAWCPMGDNPRTYGVNEVQQLKCNADNGTFILSFRENFTTPIYWNTSVEQFALQLEQLYTIGKVDVSVIGRDDTNSYNGNICSIDGSIALNIEFLTEFGDLPLLQADLRGIANIDPVLQTYTNGFLMNITEYQKGTKEEMECSGQGMCDEDLGQCKCFEGFGSSNGTIDNPGEKGDCSFFNRLYTTERR